MMSCAKNSPQSGHSHSISCTLEWLEPTSLQVNPESQLNSMKSESDSSLASELDASLFCFFAGDDGGESTEF